MDPTRFDAIARTVAARSRRQVTRALAGVALGGLLGRVTTRPAAAELRPCNIDADCADLNGRCRNDGFCCAGAGVAAEDVSECCSGRIEDGVCACRRDQVFCGGQCCGRAKCCDGVCCPGNQTCDATGVCGRCSRREVTCGNRCCPTSGGPCCGGHCCPEDLYYCTEFGCSECGLFPADCENRYPGKGKVCVEGRCVCLAGGRLCGGTCCPANRTCCKGVCCGAGVDGCDRRTGKCNELPCDNAITVRGERCCPTGGGNSYHCGRFTCAAALTGTGPGGCDLWCDYSNEGSLCGPGVPGIPTGEGNGRACCCTAANSGGRCVWP